MSNIESAIADDVKLYHRHNADRIKALLAAGDKLLIARADTKHGEWLHLLKRVGIRERTARNWMTLSKAVQDGRLKSATVADLGVRFAVWWLANTEAMERFAIGWKTLLSAPDPSDPPEDWHYPATWDDPEHGKVFERFWCRLYRKDRELFWDTWCVAFALRWPGKASPMLREFARDRTSLARSLRRRPEDFRLSAARIKIACAQHLHFFHLHALISDARGRFDYYLILAPTED